MTKLHLLLLTLTLSASELRAADWPQWGNTSDRNMVSNETGLPDSWAPGKAKGDGFLPGTGENIRWIARLGTACYGSPIVAGGKVLVGTNNAAPRDPNIAGDHGVLMCFDEASGAFLWQVAVPKLSEKINDGPEWGICSSPAVEGSHAYVVSNRDELLCLDLNAKGKTIWRVDMVREFDAFPRSRSSSSPLVTGELVIVSTGNGLDPQHDLHGSKRSAPSVVALDKHTGKTVWTDNLKLSEGERADCGLTHRIFRGQWSSVSLGTVNGHGQLYFAAGDGVLYALEPKTGELIWSADCIPPEQKKNAKGFILYPDYKGPTGIVATPVFCNNRVYVATGDDPDRGEGLGALTCLDAAQKGDVTNSAKDWTYKPISRSLSTVSIHNNLLFLADYSGDIHCLDATTGQLHWRHSTGAHIWGSTLVADGKLYVGNEDGTFLIMAASPAQKILSQVKVGAGIFSTPIVANGRVYAASQTNLFAIEAKK